MLYRIADGNTYQRLQNLNTLTTNTIIDASKGDTVEFTLGADITLSITKTGNSTISNTLTLFITNGGSHTITWPSNVTWVKLKTPMLKPDGLDIITLITKDNGLTWYSNVPYINTVEEKINSITELQKTLVSTSWSNANIANGYYSYKISSDYITTKSVIVIYPDVTSMSYDQISAFNLAILYLGTLSNGYLELRAYGTLPTVNIPIILEVINGDIVNKNATSLYLKINSGTTENTDLYTYNGSATKTLDIKAGSNITFTTAENSLTINSSGGSGGSGSSYTAGAGLTLSGSEFSHKTNIDAAGTVGSATSIPIITYDTLGHITGVNSATVSITDSKVSNILSPTTKAYITGTTSNSSNVGTQVFDNNVYLGSTTGSLYATTFYGNLSGNATTATTATKLGSDTIGSNYTPIYLNEGTATALSSTIGSTTLPVYLNAGTITVTGNTLDVGITGNAATATTATTSETSNKTKNSFVIKLGENTTTTEGTDLYTFDGSTAKSLNIKSGSGVTFTTSEGSLIINSSGTTYTAGTGISIINNAINLSNTAVNPTIYGNNSTTPLTYGGTFIIPKYTVDAQGRITNSENVTMTLPSTDDTNTHYKATNIISTSNTSTTNTASTNENTYLNIIENSAVSSSIKLNGTGATTISNDGSGTLTINSINTTYTAGNGLTLTDTEFSLSASGATAGNYGTATNTTLTSGGTFTIPYYTVDTYGRLTNSSNVIMTLPESSTGTSSNTDKINVTLLAADWVSTNQATTGYYTYTISNASILATSLAELEPNIQTATLSQLSSYQVANIFIGTISAGAMELRAYGDVPTVDIPITLKLNNSNTSSQVEQSITFRDNTGTVVSYNGTSAVDLSNGVYSRNSGIPLFSINSDMKLVATFADSKDAGTFSVNSDGKLVYTLE